MTHGSVVPAYAAALRLFRDDANSQQQTPGARFTVSLGLVSEHYANALPRRSAGPSGLDMRPEPAAEIAFFRS